MWHLAVVFVLEVNLISKFDGGFSVEDAEWLIHWWVYREKHYKNYYTSVSDSRLHALFCGLYIPKFLRGFVFAHFVSFLLFPVSCILARCSCCMQTFCLTDASVYVLQLKSALCSGWMPEWSARHAGHLAASWAGIRHSASSWSG